MSLRPCEGCGRHVRNTETTCPFCASALAVTPERTAVVLPRAGRAAIMAFGAIASASTVGCGGVAPAYGTPAPDAGPASIDAAPSVEDDAFVMGGTDAAYGGPPLDAAVSDTSMAESDTGGGTNLYGGPPTEDAGGQTDTGEGGAVPLYGGAGI
ncbi:MAG: hypothetical protein J0L92_19575 [Deltaproteobacteria bacterium]|nr:hypothetical protein [Deltaproteobacteria bacterium]